MHVTSDSSWVESGVASVRRTEYTWCMQLRATGVCARPLAAALRRCAIACANASKLGNLASGSAFFSDVPTSGAVKGTTAGGCSPQEPRNRGLPATRTACWAVLVAGTTGFSALQNPQWEGACVASPFAARRAAGKASGGAWSVYPQ